MQLHLKAGTIPSLSKDPEEALRKLEEHHQIQVDLKKFIRFSEDDKRTNLYTEENVSIITSIFPYQITYPTGILERKERFQFPMATLDDDLDIAMSLVEANLMDIRKK